MGISKKIITGLDFSDTDAQVLQTLSELNKLLHPEKVTYINIHKEIDLPEEVLKTFPDLKSDVNEEFIKKMVEECDGFNIVGTDTEYLALEGNPLKEIMSVAEERDADVIIVGRKETREKGISHAKLVRGSYCDVLLASDKGSASFNKILVASDFSDYSKLAMERAIELAAASGGSILCQHVYEVPRGYSKTGKSYEEFADIMEKNSRLDYETFMKSIDTKGVSVEPLLTLGDSNDSYEHVITAAKAANSDLIVIGAKGRTGMAAMFVGSVAEKIIENCISKSIYVVKKKGSEYGLLDAIID